MTKTLTGALLAFGIILMTALTALAASFTATVDRATVAPGESVTLGLEVSGADPKDAPDLTPLSGDFRVVSQGQTSQTSIINGAVSTSTGWNIMLVPKKSGALTIPALTVETESGSLKSDAIAVNVGKSASAQQGGRDDGLSMSADVSKRDPYQNEPVLLTVKLISRQNLSDITGADFTVDNAIVELQGKAEGHEGVVGGQRVIVVEAKFLVTPLQPGPLKIPPFSFQGKVELGAGGNPFGIQIPSFPDPFGLMQNLGTLPGFLSRKPFDISGPEISLDVKKPAAEMDPWLPLESLKVSDEWDDAQKPRVGEPLTRKITLAAVGGTGAVLPDLENRIDPEANFRIYADKPDRGQSLRADGEITGWRQESFTLIPQKSGKLTLPEIRVPWWDVENNKVAYAVLPEKKVEVMPGAAVAEAPTAAPVPVAPPQVSAKPAAAPAPAVHEGGGVLPPYFYLLIGVLGAAVIVLCCIVVHLSRRLSRLAASGTSRRASVTVTANEDRISPGALKEAATPDALRAFLQAYAHQHWGLSPNAALESVTAALERRLPATEAAAARDCIVALDAALYAGRGMDMEDAKRRCADALKAAEKVKNGPRSAPKKAGALNPS